MCLTPTLVGCLSSFSSPIEVAHAFTGIRNAMPYHLLVFGFVVVHLRLFLLDLGDDLRFLALDQPNYVL